MSVVTERGSDFAGLSRRVVRAGLLDRRPGYYLALGAGTVGLFAACWAAFAWVGDSWAQVFVALALGVASTQLSFFGHDAGHRQIARSRRVSAVLGMLCGNLAVGLSYGWWIDKHTRHHANPNHSEDDPDVGVGALVWTAEQAAGRRSGFARLLTRQQAYLFFPLLLLEGLNLHVASVRAVISGPVKQRGIEAALLLMHVSCYLGVLLVVLSPVKALVFVVVHKGLWGVYMGCAFAPNHKGMPDLSDEERLDFLRRQVLTSRNVNGGPVVDIALGGLNYQIEHHLFPSMPRPNLRRAQPIVRAYCAELGIPYTATGLLNSYRQALGHLHAVGAPLRVAAS